MFESIEKSKISKRTVSRIFAVQALYTNDMYKNTLVDRESREKLLFSYNDIFKELEEFEDYIQVGFSKNFYNKLLDNFFDNIDNVNKTIIDNLQSNFFVETLGVMILSILKCGVTELLYMRDDKTVYNIILSEYVKISKIFLNAREVKIINAILGKIATL